jgi:hypothetical protein
MGNKQKLPEPTLAPPPGIADGVVRAAVDPQTNTGAFGDVSRDLMNFLSVGAAAAAKIYADAAAKLCESENLLPDTKKRAIRFLRLAIMHLEG